MMRNMMVSRRVVLSCAAITAGAMASGLSGCASGAGGPKPLMDATSAMTGPKFWRFAPTPPMGWNSYDAYGATVTEAQYLANAEYQRAHLLPSGWQYCIIDYLWFDPWQATAHVKSNAPLEIDAFGRPQPALNKFPSAEHGLGFAPLSKKIHAMGLKFGFHIMRGIPRRAVELNTPIWNSHFHARDAANTHDTCNWNGDMYGVRGDTAAGRAWYNSLFQQYSREWEIDFIKVDDLSHPYHIFEIEAIRAAINGTGRAIVFSTSPGRTAVAEGTNISHDANMWRISGDFWDNWAILNRHFDLVAAWHGFGGPGHWPDADMLPLGRLSIGNTSVGRQRWSNFTRDEQRTVMNLWSMAPSPLMMGGELISLDRWTHGLLTNPEIIAINQDLRGAQGTRVARHGPLEIWTRPLHDDSLVIAAFNRGADHADAVVDFVSLGLQPQQLVRDPWKRKTMGIVRTGMKVELAPHASRLLRVWPA